METITITISLIISLVLNAFLVTMKVLDMLDDRKANLDTTNER